MVVANNVDNKYYRGHKQGNSGNSAVNRWYTEDHSSNAGNQIIHQGAIWHGRNNQRFRQRTANAQNFFYVGYQQGNSGNSGVNRGYNRDTSGNLGNSDKSAWLFSRKSMLLSVHAISMELSRVLGCS